MVFNLENIQHIEDKNLLSGHLLVLLGQDHQTAQVSYSIVTTTLSTSTAG